MKSENCIDDVILNSNFVTDADRCWGVGNWIFQQDNAPAHRSSETKAVLNELGLTLLDWPPYSPDLNVIELVWAIMEDEVEKRNPKTLDELRDIVNDVWDALKWPTINGLINSMEERLGKVYNSPDKTIYQLYH